MRATPPVQIPPEVNAALTWCIGMDLLQWLLIAFMSPEDAPRVLGHFLAYRPWKMRTPPKGPPQGVP